MLYIIILFILMPLLYFGMFVIYDFVARKSAKRLADYRYKDFCIFLDRLPCNDESRIAYIDGYLNFIKCEHKEQRWLLRSKFSKSVTKTYYEYLENRIEKLKG